MKEHNRPLSMHLSVVTVLLKARSHSRELGSRSSNRSSIPRLGREAAIPAARGSRSEREGDRRGPAGLTPATPAVWAPEPGSSPCRSRIRYGSQPSSTLAASEPPVPQTAETSSDTTLIVPRHGTLPGPCLLTPLLPPGLDAQGATELTPAGLGSGL